MINKDFSISVYTLLSWAGIPTTRAAHNKQQVVGILDFLKFKLSHHTKREITFVLDRLD